MNDKINKISELGFLRVGAATPKLKVADPFYNITQIGEIINKANEEKIQIIVFPELSISGYSCQDLFYQSNLLDSCIMALLQLLEKTKKSNIVFTVGMPLKHKGQLYNCAVLIKSGEILGVVPKTYIPNTNEFYEKRWFASGEKIGVEKIVIDEQETLFGKLLFEIKELNVKFGIEICEDLWAVIPPSSQMALEGANLILNLSASNELVGKESYRKELIKQQSARTISGYVYAGSGVYESTTDLVFSGDLVIAENGKIQATTDRFKRENNYIFTDLDMKNLEHERTMHTNFTDSIEYKMDLFMYDLIDIKGELNIPDYDEKLIRDISSTPFVPADEDLMNKNCSEIFNIQTAGLAKRMEHTKLKKAVLGISGGLDSTLALLVVVKTFELLNLPKKNIIAVTMPGFGTTDSTYNNAVDLIKNLGVTFKEINIKNACISHFKDIGHDENIHDTTYENTQARERTQILMDLANKENALVVGTGDLSELALGWCTYNGDHMSMYSVNSSIPKTLIIYIIKWVGIGLKSEISNILQKVLDTPISPELLPPDDEGKIAQKTESLIGPYKIHDFFLYHFIRKGSEPEKILYLAKKAFAGEFSDDEIENSMNIFFKRFFTQQFKRSCMPDGPKVGSVSLSPRGDWKMPSDASFDLWNG